MNRFSSFSTFVSFALAFKTHFSVLCTLKKILIALEYYHYARMTYFLQIKLLWKSGCTSSVSQALFPPSRLLCKHWQEHSQPPS